MKLACHLLLVASLAVFSLPAISNAETYAAYTLLYSSNVAGEIEPCG
jgi:hypothetical protein